MASAGKALLGLAFRGEDVPDDFLSSFSVGKLVTRDSVKLRKEQSGNTGSGARKVSFSSSQAAAAAAMAESAPNTLGRKVSFSSQRSSDRQQAQYVNEDEDSTQSDDDDDYDEEEDSNFGALPRARIGSISKAARRSSLEIAKERKGSKVNFDESAKRGDADTRRKSSFANNPDSRRKVSFNGNAQQRNQLDLRMASGPDPEAPDIEGTVDEAARRSSLTLAKKRKSSVKAKQAEMARQGVMKPTGGSIVEEGQVFACFPAEGGEDFTPLSFVFQDGSDMFMLYDPKFGPRNPTLDVQLSAKHSAGAITHVEMEDGANANSFDLTLFTQDGPKVLVEIASPDSALIGELHHRMEIMIEAKHSQPAKKGGMSVLFGKK